MFFCKGQPIFVGVAFTDPESGMQHPANWSIWNAQEREDRGITEIPDPNPDAIIIDLETVQKDAVLATKFEARLILADSDWKVIRAIEPVLRKYAQEIGDQDTLNILDEREGIRSGSDSKESLILEATNQEEVFAASLPTIKSTQRLV